MSGKAQQKPGLFARVLLDIPIAPSFDYRIPPELLGAISVGQWVVVPWGRARKVGIVCDISAESSISADRIKALQTILPGAPVLNPDWFRLGEFAASYYHRQPGEVLLPSIPKLLRVPPRLAESSASTTDSGSDATKRKKPRATKSNAFDRANLKYQRQLTPEIEASCEPAQILGEQQQTALNGIVAQTGFGAHLLHGVTGSGKTEVYLHWIAHLLALRPEGQILALVPEIALTPQLVGQIDARFKPPMAVLHSGMAEGERAGQWLAAAQGRARIVVGTRLSVMVPLPGLCAIIIDEEHDPSFKQQESPHYSARDLAIWRARALDIPILLGSATPSLETWYAASVGRYGLHRMPTRATGAALPQIQIEALSQKNARPAPVGAEELPVIEGMSPVSVAAMRENIERSEQTLVFLNRRGYAPVLNCPNCGWLSQCDHCSAYRVLHRPGETESASGHARYRLICHHCGSESPPTRACPDCGELGLQPMGQGTQRIEDLLKQAFPDANVGRLDRDVARRRGAADKFLTAVHAGEIDIVVGTQMLAKGHDFKRLSLVIVMDADGALFASDFRAPERLFATLSQVAGRAGRQVDSSQGKVIVQTRFVDHPLYQSLKAQDYDGFANQQLSERRDANLPPFSFHALLRADAQDSHRVMVFLNDAAECARELLENPGAPDGIIIYDPVPMPMAKVAGRVRAQLLIESSSRPGLHSFLNPLIDRIQVGAGIRWALEIDPSEI